MLVGIVFVASPLLLAHELIVNEDFCAWLTPQQRLGNTMTGGLLGGMILGLILGYPFQWFVLTLNHYRDVVTLSEEGITFVHGRNHVLLPWEEIIICPHHGRALHLVAGNRKGWVLPGIARFGDLDRQIRDRIRAVTNRGKRADG